MNLPTRWRRKPAGSGLKRNYVIVTPCVLMFPAVDGVNKIRQKESNAPLATRRVVMFCVAWRRFSRPVPRNDVHCDLTNRTAAKFSNNFDKYRPISIFLVQGIHKVSVTFMFVNCEFWWNGVAASINATASVYIMCRQTRTSALLNKKQQLSWNVQ